MAVLEILSPGNKSGRSVLSDLVRKAHDLLTAGIHLALVDLFRPTAATPRGFTRSWGRDAVFRFNPAQPLTCASYIGGPEAEAFVEPVAVGEVLPTLPLFLTPYEYVPVDLEGTYEAAFAAVPDFSRNVLTTPGHSP